MILVRSPLRISLGGGGTDLPSYYEKYGGFFISAAVNKYVYLMMSRMFKPGFSIKYSRYEEVAGVNDIEHPIIRAVTRKYMPRETGVEIVSTADIPAGTGMGSSASFTAALIKSIYAFNRMVVSPRRLAEEACEIEINVLREPVGKQDQYITAFGGVTCFEIGTDGTVHVSPLQISEETRCELEDNLLLFFTGYSRNASEVLRIQNNATIHQDEEMISNLHFVKKLGIESKAALERGDAEQFAGLMNTHWVYKKKRAGAMTNGQIDYLYDMALKNGALGGKLIGAGGGGFLMFYAYDKRALRKKMQAEGLREIRFKFDFKGTDVMF
ncbi:MAG: GHMP kinase [Clostridiales bacterium]|jgi:D-glycero-alpha-D-manno-heptose-7-phosphate kinase|nr:GHMP kinase [Clostridiales bacterium]